MRQSCYGQCVVFKDDAEATPFGGRMRGVVKMTLKANSWKPASHL